MMRQMVLYLLHFLVLFTQDTLCSNSQIEYCRQYKQVVKICAETSLTNLTDVNIDTFSVPKCQEIVCECTIFPIDPGLTFNFEFSYYERVVPRNLVFKINDVPLSSINNTIVSNTGSSKLSLITTENYTMEGTCLTVSADYTVRFDISCSPQKGNSTTVSGTSSTFMPGQTTYNDEPDTELNAQDTKDTGRSPFIIPVVASLSGLVVLVIVILVIIFCRRRSLIKKQQSATPSADVDKKDDDDYYMTENPMYNATDIPQKTQNSESEYHYVEHDNHDVRMSTNQYESNPDSPLKKQLPPNDVVEHEHYDYSTCLSNNKQALKTNKARASLPSDQSAGTENVYDRTDNTLAKPFMGENEYHHLTPTGPRRLAAVDTYNTIGSVGSNKHEQERNVDDSEYHVTSSQ